MRTYAKDAAIKTTIRSGNTCIRNRPSEIVTSAGKRSSHQDCSTRRSDLRRRLCQSATGQYPDKMGTVFGASVDITVHPSRWNGHALERLRRKALLQRLLK